jgi:hypothetical protein
MRLHAILIAVALTGSIPGTARAQGDARQTPVCWLRPAPLDRCRTFLVTEAAVEIPVVTTPTRSRPARPRRTSTPASPFPSA